MTARSYYGSAYPLGEYLTTQQPRYSYFIDRAALPAGLGRRESAAAQRRLFAGPLLPTGLARPGLIPAVPGLPGLRFQALHSADAGQA
jgi:hypothetical protein